MIILLKWSESIEHGVPKGPIGAPNEGRVNFWKILTASEASDIRVLEQIYQKIDHERSRTSTLE